jgi:D-alanine-D-alanine ligase
MGKTIGFTYDLKSDHSASKGLTDDAYAEFDVEDLIREVAEAIESGGHKVVRIGHARNLLNRMGDLGVDIVFNICEGIGSRNRESEVPVILDMFKIPFVGSDGLTLGLSLDKVTAKKVFACDGVPTPKYFIADKKIGLSRMGSMKFPLIVKPRHEGSSKGISDNSIVSDKKSLKAQINSIVDLYRQSALVEEFIRGSEFTVLVIGNETPQALPPVQIKIAGNLDAGDLVYTSRRLTGPDIEYVCPAKISKNLDKQLRAVAIKAYQALDCRDFGRVDFRVDAKGRLYVLEINPLPSLSTEDVFPLVAQANGMTYNQLILKIIDIALIRNGLNGHTNN